MKDFDTIEKELREKRGPQEEKNARKDARYYDLKNRIFYHAASYMFPIAVTVEVESLRIAEIRRSAKYTALLLLISEVGLADEYHDWLREKGYE